MTADTDRLREALAHWASGVTIVAARDEARVVATTVSAFLSLSLEPPLVLIALGPNATVLPYLQPGSAFGISVLGHEQRQLAAVFADPYPVGPSPFPPAGEPLVDGAMVGLACTVQETRPGGDHVIIIAAVDAVRGPFGAEPLVRFRRKYRRLGP
jgi:flavin reductase (NADH)